MKRKVAKKVTKKKSTIVSARPKAKVTKLKNVSILRNATHKVDGEDVPTVVIRESVFSRLAGSKNAFDKYKKRAIAQAKELAAVASRQAEEISDLMSKNRRLEIQSTRQAEQIEGLQRSQNLLKRADEDRRGVTIPDGTRSPSNIPEEKLPANQFIHRVTGGLGGLNKK